MRKNYVDDSLNVLMVEAGLKGSKDSDPEMEDIEPTLGYDIPYGEPETPEPPKHQNSRNKPGMSKKTKGNAPEAGSDKMYQMTASPDGDGGTASQNAAA